ncbi:hypothetical protein BSL82_10655 [Tardibacter chloracetimidivorans]|uniref:Rieske domain-containing protein n=2 Tax=Tardibacter chloracetimidivorans TaxID=1921510 RepID=A0A1L3ZVQ5_9SPHN|nr:hypothetical protein BSL82_10655 [Tardibacter chloracetimidivorans]
MPYLRNCWYMAAWSDGVGPGKVIGRTILDEPVALFRDTVGQIGAVEDRCPHRFAPLSAGKVNDRGILVCGYHGLGFDRTGACVANPHGAVLRAARVRSWPVVERYGIIWIWMGDAARCDPGLIPDFSWLDAAPASARSHGEILSGGGGYELYVDNIMDLSHTDHLHADTLGGGGVVFNKPKVTSTDEWIEVAWQSRSTRPPAFYPRMIPNLPELVDLTLRVRWFAASAMRLDAEVRHEGKEGDDCHRGTAAHIFTPESEDSTHYFYAMTRNYAADDEAVNQMIAETRARIFQTEDKPMIERVHAAMKGRDFWDMKPLLLRIDEGGVQVRRRLLKLIEDEARREPALAAS